MRICIPAISVILPVYNSEKYVSESINSILNQSFEDFEFLIINDGSTDQSKDIIMSYNDKRIKYIENKHNQGLIKTLNKGLQFSQGQYIARMDADDLCHANRFEKQIDYFNHEKNVDILGTNQYIIGTNKTLMRMLSNEENRIRLLLEPVAGHPTIMMRKSSLINYNLYYDRQALFAEDYKLLTDTSLCGLRINNLPECLCSYRYHKDQISNTKMDIQRFIADKIRIAYAKHFFHNIINENEQIYLFLIHGINLSLKEKYMSKIEKIKINLQEYNNLYGHFNVALFNEFLNARMTRL